VFRKRRFDPVVLTDSFPFEALLTMGIGWLTREPQRMKQAAGHPPR
jgi:hypothetical protein